MAAGEPKELIPTGTEPAERGVDELFARFPEIRERLVERVGRELTQRLVGRIPSEEISELVDIACQAAARALLEEGRGLVRDATRLAAHTSDDERAAVVAQLAREIPSDVRAKHGIPVWELPKARG